MTTASSTTDTNPASSLLTSLNGTKTNTAAANQISDTQNRFLKLLTAQLKNQDPLNPMDNAQMTSQMAQISTVDGIEKLNTTLTSMMSGAIDTQTSQAAAMVGTTVLVPGSSMTLASGGSGYAGFDLAKAADYATVTVKDSNGLVVRTMTLKDLPAGTNTFTWDGKDDAGVAAAAGNYTFSVSAKQGSNTVTSTALAFGSVGSVNRTGTTLSFTVGSLGTYSLSDIRKIY